MKQVLDTNNKQEGKQTKSSLARKLGISRGMLYYQHKRSHIDEEIKKKIEKVMETHKSYGHKRIALELDVNKKKKQVC